MDGNFVIPGTIPEPGISLSFMTIDSYQPEVFGGSLLFPLGDDFEVTLSVEQHKWSKLGEKFAGDTVRDQANLEFRDITVPRAGIRYNWSDRLTLVGGLSVEESPLTGRESQDVNFLDSDRAIIGLGGSYRFNDVPAISLPVEVGFGYQYQQLDEREFDLTSRNSPSDPAPYETVRADGEVHVFSGSVELAF